VPAFPHGLADDWALRLSRALMSVSAVLASAACVLSAVAYGKRLAEVPEHLGELTVCPHRHPWRWLSDFTFSLLLCLPWEWHLLSILMLGRSWENAKLVGILAMLALHTLVVSAMLYY